jgi:hypothetical protein
LFLLALLLVSCTRPQGTGDHGRYSSTFVHWVYQTRPIPSEIDALLRDAAVDPANPTLVPRLRELANRQSFVNMQLRGAEAPSDQRRYHDAMVGATLRFEEDIAMLRVGSLPSTPLEAVQELQAAQWLLMNKVIGCYTKQDACKSETVG